MRSTAWSLALGALISACSSPNLTTSNFSCNVDADCSGGKICGLVNGTRACTLPDLSPIRVGMSAPFQGASQDLGVEMRRGIQALFNHVNEEGGVNGRQLRLDALNDNYDPDIALQNTRQLLDIQEDVTDPDVPDRRGPNGVLAFLGNVGTPPMLKTAPIATKNRVVFFAPFTGAQKYLRDGTNSPYVFNYRAGYYEEMDALVDYLKSTRSPRIISGPDAYKRIMAFTQHDSYGDGGYAGLINAYNSRVAQVPQPDSSQPNPSVFRVNYERDNLASVDPAILSAQDFLSNILETNPNTRTPVAIVMVDTYQVGNKFIRAIKDWLNVDLSRAQGLDVLFSHVSFVGSDSLAEALTSPPETFLDVTDGKTRVSYAKGVMVTQVVPYYRSEAPAIKAYRADIGKLDNGVYNFTSLEGYIAAKLFVEALSEAIKINPALDSDTLVTALNTRLNNVDIGIGTLLSFSSVNHQASHTVWGTVIDADKSFKVPFSWNPTDSIVAGSY